MDVSIGFDTLIFLLFFIVIPGFIARRFYYNGEFSKQINIGISSIINLIYSFFVGVIMSLVFIFLINLFRDKDIDLAQVISDFESNYVTLNKENLKERFQGVINFTYDIMLPYCGGVYLFSAFVGLFSSKLILFLGLDTKWKFFRYGNNWHYMLNGKILKFKHHFSSDFNHKFKVKYTYLDILVSEKGEETTLYSGFFADYDLCPYDISKLEKIHLLKATRYKKINDKVITRNIPGNLFTIMGDRILNINCTYVCYSEDESKYKKFITLRKLLIPTQILITLFYIAISICLVFSLKITDNVCFNFLIEKSFFMKLYILFILNLFIGLLTPFEIKSDEKKIVFIGWELFSSKILAILFSLILLFLVPFIWNFLKGLFFHLIAFVI